MTTKETMSRRIWMHEVVVAAVRKGATAEWIHEYFDSRLVIWFNAGESINGAVGMLIESLAGEQKEARHSERTPAQVAKSIVHLNIPSTAAERIAKADAAERARTANNMGAELLAVLKELMAPGAGLHLKSNVSTDVLLRAHAAIAKAEGKS